MKHTESIAALAAALVAAQADIKAVGKDSVNPHFKNKYASLDNIIDAVRPVLAKHGLAIVQGAANPITDEAGGLCGFAVETMLVHKSGEWLMNSAIMPLTKIDAQGAGGALTYGRRYGVSALLSLSTDEDDDGNTASTPRTQGNATAAASRSASSSNGSTSNRSSTGNHADKAMPFGKTKGKRLGEHTADQLEKTLKWCKETDAEKFKDLMVSITAVLSDMALGVGAGRSTNEILHDGDELDPLPF